MLVVQVLISTYHIPRSCTENHTGLEIQHRYLNIASEWFGFPDSSVGKESACNSGDPGSIPGSGRSGEGIGYSSLLGLPLWLS